MTISMDREKLKELQRALRGLGFRRTYNGRSTVNPDCQIYERGDANHFCLDVQLWGDGGHRVSHTLRGRCSVPPTNFRELDELGPALAQQESFREGSSE